MTNGGALENIDILPGPSVPIYPLQPLTPPRKYI